MLSEVDCDTNECPYRAINEVCCVLCDFLAGDAVLLIADCECCFIGGRQEFGWRKRAYLLAVIPKCDVTQREHLCAGVL